MTSSVEIQERASKTKRAAIGLLIAATIIALAGGAPHAAAQQSAALSSAPAPAQAAGAQVTTPPTIRATVQLVSVPISARTKRGQRVIDLTMDDLKVFEDGVEQKITHFERETRTPLRIGVVLDTSNSARARLPYEKEAAQQFVDDVLSTASTQTQIFLETFDTSSSVVQDFTYDPDVLSDKIQELKAGGGKALYDAIYSACREKMLKTGPPEEVRRVLVVISDGLDVESRHTLDQTVSMARTSETMIYTVGTAAYGYDNAGDKFLERMASETGGFPLFPLRDAPGTDIESGYLSHEQIGDTSENKGEGAATGRYSADRMANLVIALQAIGHDLSEEYTVAYRPLRDAMDGTYRTITVETTRPGIILRWKPGYFAASQ